MGRDVCLRCGAPARPVPPPGVWERARAWFLHGDRQRGQRFECENGHGWTAATLYSRPGRPRRLTRVWPVIQGNRTVIPTPQSYTFVAGIGLVVGLVVWVLVGWPWWPVPILFVVVAWAMATATAFRGARRLETVGHLRDVHDPAGAIARRRKHVRDALDSAPFSLFALASHDREPWLGGSGRSNHVLTSITVSYGDPAAEVERIDVTTSAEGDPVEFVMEIQGQELRGRAMMRDGPPIDPISMSSPVEWSPVEVVIDGAPMAAHAATNAGRLTVVAEVAGTGVVIIQSGRELAIQALALRPIDPSEIADPPPL